MRWIFLLLTFVFMTVAFSAASAGMMGLSMFLTALFGFLAVMGFAQARIEAGSQPQASMIGSRDVQVLRQQSVKNKVAQSRAAQSKARQSGDSGGYASDGGISSHGGGGQRSHHADHDGGSDGASDGGGGDGGGGD